MFCAKLLRPILSRELSSIISRNYSDVASAFIKHEIVTDLLDVPPKRLLKIAYNTGRIANLGNMVMPKDARDPPELSWEADDSQYYLLVKSHIDIPSRRRPMLREFHNWIVVNIKGTNIYGGDHRYKYLPPAPMKGTGFHRYVMIIFHQPKELDFKEPKQSEFQLSERLKRSTRRLAEKYGLGNPIAGNFFFSKWDHYVPIVHGRLGIV